MTEVTKGPSSPLAEKIATASKAKAEAREAVEAQIKALCNVLADERREQGFTQQEVADGIGLSRTQVTNIEAGRGASVEAIVGYAAALGMRLTIEKGS